MEKSYTINLIENESYVIKATEAALNLANSKLFHKDMETISDKHNIELNCSSLTFLCKDWIRSLLFVQSKIRKMNKILRLSHVSQGVARSLKEQGVLESFIIVKDVVKNPNKKTVDTQFLEPFLQATMKVLSVQAQVESKPGKIQIKKSNDVYFGDVSGVIGIVSDAFNGSVVITFPEATFLTVMSNMLGETYSKLDKDLLDGAGEITNMIFGQAKVVLNEKGYGIKMALPSVISGKDHSHSAGGSGDSLVIPFESNAGNFYVEIAVKFD